MSYTRLTNQNLWGTIVGTRDFSPDWKHRDFGTEVPCPDGYKHQFVVPSKQYSLTAASINVPCGFLLVVLGELFFCFDVFEEGIEFFFDGGLPVGGFYGLDLLLGGGFCLSNEGADFEAGGAEEVGK